MHKTLSRKPLAVALGAAFVMVSGAASASLFQASDLAAGYMVASAGEAKAGDKKAGEAKCGEACVKASMDGGMKEADAKAACDKKKAEGKCGADKKPRT